MNPGRLILCLLPLTASCSVETREVNHQDVDQNAVMAPPPLPSQADPAPVAVERPTGASEPGLQAVIGATPGPCGSTKATEFLGRTWTPELAAALKRKSGADEVTVAREMSEEEAEAAESNPKRLQVVLNDSRQIILMDCG
jgi:hypothetical protein